MIRINESKYLQIIQTEHNILRDNFTSTLQLKKKIQQLNNQISQHQQTIASFNKDVKIAKINKMEIDIQHLNDQNKRLVLYIQELRGKNKSSNMLSPKKAFASSNKYEEKGSLLSKQFKIDHKIYQVLKQNETLKKQLLNLKINDNVLKKRKTVLNDRNSIFIEKNLINYQRLYQKKMDLQAQNSLMNDRIKKLQNKLQEVSKKNQQLQKINHQHIVFQSEMIN